MCPRIRVNSNSKLLQAIHSQIAQLPSYGYRRACALVNRQHTAQGKPSVNARRVYRVMAENALLQPKSPRRRQSSRPHKGKVTVAASNMRWCSDGFEIQCGSGQTVTDYLARMDLGDAQSVLAQLPAAFKHFNEVHPHSGLKMRSPREFRRLQAAEQARLQAL